MSATTYVLGVNAGAGAWHDPAAALITDQGEVLALVEEERPSRVRHAARCTWPRRSVEQCLDLAGLDRGDIAAVAIGWDEPRLCEQNGQRWGFDAPAAFLAELGFTAPVPDLYCVSHHRAHAASALYASPFEAAAVLVADGNGEDEATTLYTARRGQPLIRLARWPQTHSLGHLYEAASVWLGLGKRGEGKTMGLAAYAEHTPPDPGWLIPDGQELVSARGRDVRLGYDDLKHAWRTDVAAYAGTSSPSAAPGELHRDPTAVRVAAAAQSTVEHVMGWWAHQARRLSGLQPLCLAGGVALNCAANATLPPPVFVPPVPHDAGVALGAAWNLCPPQQGRPLSPYLGRTPGPVPAHHEGWAAAELDTDQVARLLLDGQIVGVCRGRAEAGPRALCHRSLLASPTRAGMAERLNALKRREPWRPFGPVTHQEHGGWWSSVGELDRYMLGAATLTGRGGAELPAVRHADGTTRPQQLASAEEPFVAAVLDALETAGHPPVLVNTSFNGPAEPLVDTARDALDCADRLGLDDVITDHALLHRKDAS